MPTHFALIMVRVPGIAAPIAILIAVADNLIQTQTVTVVRLSRCINLKRVFVINVLGEQSLATNPRANIKPMEVWDECVVFYVALNEAYPDLIEVVGTEFLV